MFNDLRVKRALLKSVDTVDMVGSVARFMKLSLCGLGENPNDWQFKTNPVLKVTISLDE